MPRVRETGAVAKHPQRHSIEAELASPSCPPLKDLGARYGVSRRALKWHLEFMRANHPAIFAATRAASLGLTTDAQVEALRKQLARETLHHMYARYLVAVHSEDEARAKGDARNLAPLARVTTDRLKLIGELVGELGRAQTVITQNLIVAPQWLELRGAILRALRFHPEARAAVLDAVQAVERNSVATMGEPIKTLEASNDPAPLAPTDGGENVGAGA